ncbi:hypothetical protein BM477_07380 [Boudabousia marimammalium]|uniref:Uncharacterized protein n=1 Tax=Boudabousia marimammalium TaxID=156892 RepID=A0A1Q5PJY1_9ACTO|nr:hypothetical protein BM477_07380 [Boudabousia marimammalium]
MLLPLGLSWLVADPQSFESDYLPAVAGLIQWIYVLLLLVGSLLGSRQINHTPPSASSVQPVSARQCFDHFYSATTRKLVLFGFIVFFVVVTALAVGSGNHGIAAENYPGWAHPWVVSAFACSVVVTLLELLVVRLSRPGAIWLKPSGLRWSTVLLVALAWACVFAPSSFVVFAESHYRRQGYHFQPWLHNSALLFVLFSVGVFLLLLWWLVLRLMVGIGRGKHPLARLAAVIPVLLGGAAVAFGGVFLLVALAFGVFDGESFEHDGESYLTEPVWLDKAHTCYRYEGWFWVRRTECVGRFALPSGDFMLEPRGGELPSKGAEDEAVKTSSCEASPDDCFMSVWNGGYVRVSDAQKLIDAAQLDVQRINDSGYGWVVVDAAAGSRWVFVVEEKAGQWVFLSEMPSTHGVSEASFSDGKLVLSNQDGEYVFNLTAKIWSVPL